MATRFNIVTGPGKFDLMLALFDKYQGHDRELEFTIREVNGFRGVKDYPIKFVVVGVELEDGSRESWLIKGRVTHGAVGADVHGWFDTRSRRGWIESVS